MTAVRVLLRALVCAAFTAGCAGENPGSSDPNSDLGVARSRASDSCGDAILDPDEECDDGNLLAGDACSPDCVLGKVETQTVTAAGSPVTVSLAKAYTTPVVVCTVQIANNTLPVVPRVQNVASTSFDVYLQNPSDAAVTAETLSCLVVEEGTWTLGGLKLEAQRHLSTVTDRVGSFVAQQVAYGQSYTSPVVLGQVMTTNDPDWSVFWSHGTTLSVPASPTALWVGKHVAEDPDSARADETLGFVVIEAGHGTLGAAEYEARVGPASVVGRDNAVSTYSFATAFSAAPELALLGMAGQVGKDGGWACLMGSAPLSAPSFTLTIDEDQTLDAERLHTSERVGYVAFSQSLSWPACDDLDGDGHVPACGDPSLPGPDCNDSNPNAWTSCDTCVDADTDGWFLACDAYATVSGPDCNDAASTSYPGHSELCDHLDNDCNGLIDEAVCAVASPKLETRSVTAGSAPVNVPLTHLYSSPVVVCSVRAANNTLPVVPRVRNVASDSFEVYLQNPSDAAVASDPVDCLVVEQGTWTIDGVRIEAQTHLSAVTDRVGSFVGEQVAYGQSYTSPVVFGQVMTTHDPDWSVFWSHGPTLSVPASPTALWVGKHVAEDPDSVRADEILGFVVMETGHATLGGVAYEARVGPATVVGRDNATSTYSFASAFSAVPEFAVVGMAGQVGKDGGWACPMGAAPMTATTLSLAIDEDQTLDTERLHTSERVGYITFELNVASSSCDDLDGDGYYNDCDDPGVPGPDCDDADPNAWIACETCLDADLDGWFAGCDAYATVSGPDCDDALSARYPGNPELCDGLDNDCNGLADAAGGEADADGDGHLACADCSDSNANAWTSCATCLDADADGWFVGCDAYATVTGPDCNDAAGTNHPGHAELCDGLDNDCDGLANYSGGEIDGDGDGHLACADCSDANANAWSSCTTCVDSDGDGWYAGCDAYATVSGPDCNDVDAANYPGRAELCDDQDNDCDARIDEGACAEPAPRLETQSVTAGGDPVTVALANVYASPVVVCSVRVANNTLPVVPRVQNVASDAFDVYLQNPSEAAISSESIHCLVVEEGAWTIDGVRLEARTHASTVTDRLGSFVGQQVAYAQTYTSPVVVGQVMTTNDPDWSVFWSRGTRLSVPASSSALWVGKHVGEDPDTARADETLGFVVIEAGHGALAGAAYEAMVGPASVVGRDNGLSTYTFTAPFSAPPELAVLSMGGQVGKDGGWACLMGAAPMTASTVTLAIEEDQTLDTERLHTSERVGTIAFEQAVASSSCDDVDGDGYYTACEAPSLPGPDCNDADPNVWTSCESCIDADGDGWFAGCDAYRTVNGPDCNDSQAAIHPGHAELCDGLDNDCNGLADFSGGESDSDGDGHLACADCSDTNANAWGSCVTCVDADGDSWFAGCDAYVTVNGPDCDDGDLARYPGNPEVCDGLDNDCNGLEDYPAGEADEDTDGYLACEDCSDADSNSWASCATCADSDGDTWYAACDAYDTVSGPDCNDASSASYPGNPEVCDGLDNDCSGSANYPGGETDADGDGRLGCADCSDANPNVWTSCATCADGDGDTWYAGCDAYTTVNGPDCDDAASANYPGNTEVCDAEDNDCDGSTDETLTPTPAEEQCTASQNLGECIAATECVWGAWTCVVDVGPTPEACDTLDNDCDGQADEEDVCGGAGGAGGADGTGGMAGAGGAPPADPATLIATGSTWKYLDTGTDQGTAWTSADFDDSAWPSAPAELGYGDGDETTVLSYGPSSTSKYVTTYFRTEFTVNYPSTVASLELTLKRDDGAILYLNGVEVYRTNMPTGSVSYSTLASSQVSGTGEDFLTPVSLDPAYLVAGTNVLAVEIHQGAVSSSDLSFDLGLTQQQIAGGTGGAAGAGGTGVSTTLIATGATWKYLDNGTDQGTAWAAAAFDDSAWASGPAELGYGDGGEATVVSYGSSSSSKYVTTYFRNEFGIDDPSSVTSLELTLKRDDGAIVYLNGTEVHRTNMPAGTVTYTTLASSAVDGTDEDFLAAVSLDPAYLVAGTNVIAVEIHQASRSSSDISFDLELTATGAGGGGTGGIGGTGGAGTGGSAATGGAGATGGTGGNAGAPSAFGFFVLSDIQLSSTTTYVQTAVDQMALIDDDPIAGISVGDLTNDATDTQWTIHNGYVDQMFDRAATDFGGSPRYLGVLGNHDTYATGWATRWLDNLTGQSALAPSPSTNAQYILTYQNVLFAMMDSEHAGAAATSCQSDQSQALEQALLEDALGDSPADFKFLFYHRPVYTCESTHDLELPAGLAWVALAEDHGVDVIFNGHTHVYTRTHPLLGGQRTADGTGVVQVEVGPVGYTPRSVNMSDSYTITGTGTDANGDGTCDARSDTYNCSTNAETGNLAMVRNSARTFCHVEVEDCLAVFECYEVSAGNTTPFDSWIIDHCE